MYYFTVWKSDPSWASPARNQDAGRMTLLSGGSRERIHVPALPAFGAWLPSLAPRLLFPFKSAVAS